MSIHQTITAQSHSAGLLHSLAGGANPLSTGGVHVRLARNAEEIAAAQRLRYRVFYVERGLTPQPGLPAARDADRFDAHCDHLLAVTGSDEVVGTYRLLSGIAARRGIGFYSEQEFDIAGFLNANQSAALLELGRSCVLEPYRTKRTIEALWRGISDYVSTRSVDVMFGCVSLPGTRGTVLDTQIGFLARAAALPSHLNVASHAGHRRGHARLDDADDRRIFASLPPLVKAYLRLGARFSTSAFVDRDLDVTDLFVVLRMADIGQRYRDHFCKDSTSAAMPSR